MPFNYLQRNTSVFWGLIILIISYGCTQLTPRYLTASAYEKSLILYNEGSLVEAREKLAGIKKGEFDYKEAQELLLRIDRSALKFAERHRELGEEYERVSLYSVAAKEYRIALKFDPANQILQKRLKAAEEGKSSLQQEKEPPKESSKGKKTLSPDILAEEHYITGVTLLESKQYAKAIDAFETVLKLVPSYRDTEKLLALSKKERDEIVETHLKNGIAYFQKEELELATKEWDIVLELDSLNKTAIDYKARAEAIMEKMKDIRERSK